MGVSVGNLGSARAQYHLRQRFAFLNLFPVNQSEVMIANTAKKFDAQGNLTDPVASQLISQLLTNLVEWANRLKRS
jgi:chromate reductase